MASKKPPKRISGGAALTKSGKVPLMAGVLPDERETIRAAAKVCRLSMAQFTILHTLAAAKKILENPEK